MPEESELSKKEGIVALLGVVMLLFGGIYGYLCLENTDYYPKIYIESVQVSFAARNNTCDVKAAWNIGISLGNENKKFHMYYRDFYVWISTERSLKATMEKVLSPCDGDR